MDTLTAAQAPWVPERPGRSLCHHIFLMPYTDISQRQPPRSPPALQRSQRSRRKRRRPPGQ